MKISEIDIPSHSPTIRRSTHPTTPKLHILGIIPAREGSKGIPRKNIRLLHGKPLIAYTAQAAHAAKNLSQLILSTDSEVIAQVGRSLNIEVPFLRPSEIAQDDTPMLPVLQHAVKWMEAHEQKVDVICLLQPTSPLRTANDIDAALALFLDSGADTLFSVLPIPHKYNPHWAYIMTNNGDLALFSGESTPIPRRQELPQAFHREGSLYIVKRDTLIDKNTLYGERIIGFPINPAASVNLDTQADWELAEHLIDQMSSTNESGLDE